MQSSIPSKLAAIALALMINGVIMGSAVLVFNARVQNAALPVVAGLSQENIFAGI